MLIRGAEVFANGKVAKKDILISGKRIVKISKKIDSRAEAIDADGLLALPGLIDIHAHMREPGQEWKEDFRSGSMAALAGGYTLIYDMPNNLPKPTTTKAALDRKKKLAKRARCEVRFHFGATKDNFSEVKKAKPESLKMYLGETTGNLLLRDKEAIYRHMVEFPKDRPIFVHADGKEIAMAVRLAEKAKRKIHITHVPTAAGLKTAKRYTFATTDCTPHHMFLGNGDFSSTDWRRLVKPHLQENAEVQRLWKNLEKIDAIGTDHAPHQVEDKMGGAYGYPGLETALGLFLDAYSRKQVRLEWIVSRFAENPAKIMGLWGQGYGKLVEGGPANITLIDLKKEWVVRGEEFFSKAKWSPFEGRKLTGKVVKTICKGELVNLS